MNFIPQPPTKFVTTTKLGHYFIPQPVTTTMSTNSSEQSTLGNILEELDTSCPPPCQIHPKFDEKWDNYIKDYNDYTRVKDQYRRRNYIIQSACSLNYAQLFAELAHIQFHQSQELMTMTKQLANVQKLLVELSELEKEHLKLVKEENERSRKWEEEREKEEEDSDDEFILTHDSKKILDELIKKQAVLKLDLKKTESKNEAKEEPGSAIHFVSLDPFDSKNKPCVCCNLPSYWAVLPINYHVCFKCMNILKDVINIS